jgi:imidazolonepropionase
VSEKVKPKADFVIHSANQVITVGGFNDRPKLCNEMNELGIIEDGAIAIQKDKIIWVGHTSELLQCIERPNSEREIDAKGKTVLPGFIDTHNHLIFAGFRENEFLQRVNEGLSYSEIAKSGGGIIRTVMATRSESFDTLLSLGIKRVHQMIWEGTTTSEAKSGYGLNIDGEIKMLKVIRTLDKVGPINLIPTLLIHGIPPEYKGEADKYVDVVTDEMIPEVARDGLAKFCDGTFAPARGFSKKQSEKMFKRAQDFGLKTRIHGDEFSPEEAAEFAAKIHAHSVDHCIHSSEKGIKALKESGTIANLLPLVPFNLMMNEYANARKMIDMGIPVALGTDFSPSCLNHSMMFVIALACLKMKMTPAEAISAATINAAHSVGEARNVGSLEKGKKADILIIAAPNYIHIPYSLGSHLVEKIFKNGNLLQ